MVQFGRIAFHAQLVPLLRGGDPDCRAHGGRSPPWGGRRGEMVVLQVRAVTMATAETLAKRWRWISTVSQSNN